MNELHPSECLIRLCRFCKHPMKQYNYEADQAYRWYMFECASCDIHTVIGESVEPEHTCVPCDDRDNHEPLHHTEEYQQNNHKYR